MPNFIGIDSLNEKFKVNDIFLPIFMVPTLYVGVYFESEAVFLINEQLNEHLCQMGCFYSRYKCIDNNSPDYKSGNEYLVVNDSQIYNAQTNVDK